MPERSDNVEKIARDIVEDFNGSKIGEKTQPRWHKHVALTTLVMVLLTAPAAMLVGITSD